MGIYRQRSNREVSAPPQPLEPDKIASGSQYVGSSHDWLLRLVIAVGSLALTLAYQENLTASVLGAMKLPLVFLMTGVFCFAQTRGLDAGSQTVPPPPAPVLEQPEVEVPSFSFRVVTRLVVLQIVAKDREDNPVRDLTAEELHVAERIGRSGELSQKISSFRFVDSPDSQTRVQAEGIVLDAPLHTAFCGSSGVYELSYYLSSKSRSQGRHRIFVASSRRNLRLYFRQSYQVDADQSVEPTHDEIGDERDVSRVPHGAVVQEAKNRNPTLDLGTIACYDALDSTSLQLSVHRVTTGPEFAKYEFVVPAKSLVFTLAPDHTHRVQLDLAICTFKTTGFPIRTFAGTVRQNLTQSDYQEVVAQGFPHEIEFATEGAATARLVLRDATTGALGSAELKLMDLLAPKVDIPEGGPASSFGTTTAIPSGLCGDVYNLSPST